MVPLGTPVAGLYGSFPSPFLSATGIGGCWVSDELSGKVPRPGRLTRPGSTRSIRVPFSGAPDASRTPCTSRISDGFPAGRNLVAGECSTIVSNVNDDANSRGQVDAVVHCLIAGTRNTRLYPPARAAGGITAAERIARQQNTSRMGLSWESEGERIARGLGGRPRNGIVDLRRNDAHLVV